MIKPLSLSVALIDFDGQNGIVISALHFAGQEI